MHVSVTRLKLRSWLFVLPFMRANGRVGRQAGAAAGFRQGRLLLDHGLVFWTLTGWDSAEAMKAYRDSGPHAAVMPRLQDWCDEASTAQWSTDVDGLPDWSEVYRRMIGQGRASRLKRPSSRHASMSIAPPAQSAWRSRPL
jgi:hypothetical protein